MVRTLPTKTVPLLLGSSFRSVFRRMEVYSSTLSGPSLLTHSGTISGKSFREVSEMGYSLKKAAYARVKTFSSR